MLPPTILSFRAAAPRSSAGSSNPTIPNDWCASGADSFSISIRRSLSVPSSGRTPTDSCSFGVPSSPDTANGCSQAATLTAAKRCLQQRFGKRVKNAGSKSSWTALSTSIRMPAAPPSLSSTPPRRSVGPSAPMRKVSKRRSSKHSRFPGTIWPSEAPKKACATIWRAFCILSDHRRHFPGSRSRSSQDRGWAYRLCNQHKVKRDFENDDGAQNQGRGGASGFTPRGRPVRDGLWIRARKKRDRPEFRIELERQQRHDIERQRNVCRKLGVAAIHDSERDVLHQFSMDHHEPEQHVARRHVHRRLHRQHDYRGQRVWATDGRKSSRPNRIGNSDDCRYC